MRLIELVNAGLNCTIAVILHIYQTFGTHLRTFDKVGQLIQLFAGVVCTAGNYYTSDVLCLIEYRE